MYEEPSAARTSRLEQICSTLERLSAEGALTASRALPLVEAGIAEAERSGDDLAAQMGRLLVAELRGKPDAIVRLATSALDG
jgi:hypothetical protein